MLIRVYPANGKQEKYTSAELGLAGIENQLRHGCGVGFDLTEATEAEKQEFRNQVGVMYRNINESAVRHTVRIW